MMSEKKNRNSIAAVAILLVLVIGAIIAWAVLKSPARDRHPAAEPAPQTVTEAAKPEAAEPAQTESAPAEPSAEPAEEPEDLVTIGISIRHADGSEKELSITTAALNLRGALEQEGLIEGDESEYGLFVTAVDGEGADSAKQEWWCFTRGGEMLMTGVDDTMIADGDHYEIVFTVGW